MQQYHALTYVSIIFGTFLGAAVAHERQLLPKPHQLWIRQADTSICLNDTGDCAQSNTIGDQCLSIIGMDQASLEANDTPQNAQKVRDCVCNGDYWSHLYACNSCLTANNLYPTDLNPDATPLPTLSSSYCTPAGGRSAIETIDGFVDPVTQEVSGYDVTATATSSTLAMSSQATTGGGAGRITPSPDATVTDPASARVSPYLNHSANATVTETSQSSSLAASTPSGSASSASTSGSSTSSTSALLSSNSPSSFATSTTATSATKSSGYRNTATISLSSLVLLLGVFVPNLI